MKKLSLEKLKLAAEDVLQRSQMGSIYGGSGTCELQCEQWSRRMEVNDCTKSTMNFYCGSVGEHTCVC